jgi:hypothetical protein
MAQVEPYSWGDVPTSSGGATRDLPAWMPQPPPQTGAGGAGTFVPPPCFPPVTTPPDIDVDRIRISEGYYAPGFLGPTPAGDVINPGVNFAIHSAAAAGIDLLIYFDPSSTSKQPSLRIPLDPKKNKTGDVWHVRLDNIPRGGDGYVIRYGYLVDGEFILIIARAINMTSCSFGYFWLFLVIYFWLFLVILIWAIRMTSCFLFTGGKSPDRWDYWEPNQLMVDPYAPLVEGRRVYGENESCPNGEAGAWMGAFALDETPFDWSGVEPPNIPPQVSVYSYATHTQIPNYHPITTPITDQSHHPRVRTGPRRLRVHSSGVHRVRHERPGRRHARFFPRHRGEGGAHQGCGIQRRGAPPGFPFRRDGVPTVAQPA